MKKRGQSAFDVIMLVGFILLLLAPITVFMYEQASSFKKLQVTDSLETLKNSITLLRRLGQYSAQPVTLNFPKDSSIQVNGRMVRVSFHGEEYVEEMPIELRSTPLQGSMQTVELYYSGEVAVIRGCGNDYIDSGEQCDQNNGCIQERSECISCLQCTCDENEDCSSRYCDIDVGFCTPCSADNQCSPGYLCEEGTCNVKPPPPVES